MPAGKQNNIRDRLNTMNSLPEGVVFDPNATWEKLEAKMQARPGRKYHYWYHAAAVLFLAICGFLLVNDGGRKTNEDDTLVQRPANRTQPTIITISEVQKNSAVPAEKNAGRQKERSRWESTRDNKDTFPVLSDIMIPLISTVVEPQADTLSLVKFEEPPKKKFRIAHINELGTPEPLNVLPSKTNLVVKRPPFSTISEVPLPDEERIMTKKKRAALFLTSSSQ